LLVKQELKKLLEQIDNGFDYFWAASAQQYLEYVEYNLQKLYDKNKAIKTQTYWKQRISRDLSGVQELEKKRQTPPRLPLLRRPAAAYRRHQYSGSAPFSDFAPSTDTHLTLLSPREALRKC
jgi:hypothetical protein